MSTALPDIAMQIYLPPPLDLAALPKQRPPASKLNERMKVIDNQRLLKRIMTECLKHRLKSAPLSFGFDVVSSSDMNISPRVKTARKAAGIKIIENAVKAALSWNGVANTDLKFYQTIVGRLFIGKGLALVVNHLHPQAETLSPIAVTSLVQGFLIQVGQNDGEITVDQIRVMLAVCLKDFGHLYWRWQPLSGFEGTVEEAQDYLGRIFFSDFLLSEVRIPAAAGSTLKRIREEDSLQSENPSPLKKPRLDSKATNHSTGRIFTRLRRKLQAPVAK
ncbi:hypothetical protein EV361DRAFT_915144 [Lentinula raphanica]|nr:hypothetical protein EV361DRAFT_915144 [Lentinula raphanica]